MSREIFEKLSEPFDTNEIKWKPQAVKGNRAMAIAFIDARLVMDRLDEVVGFENWQDEYKVLDDGTVVCTLKVRVDGEWISKADVGGESEQGDVGDRRKASFSDALKRAAVKFGIGRYIYSFPHQWVDYDPAKRQFARTPQLPAFAIPGKKIAYTNGKHPAPVPAPAKPQTPQAPRTLDELKTRAEESKYAIELIKVFEEYCKAHELPRNPADGDDSWTPAHVGKCYQQMAAVAMKGGK